MVFDGDEAGQLVAKRISDMAKQGNFHNSFLVDLIPVIMPDKIDPDEFIDKYGQEGFIQILKHSRKKYEEGFE